MRTAALYCLITAMALLAGCAPRKTVVQAVPKPAAVIRIDASKLAALYQSDPAAANRTFLGRVVVVSGKVAAFGEDPLEYPYVSLQTSADAQNVQCVFTPDLTTAVSSLSPGDTITARGRCLGLVSGVVQLRDCVFQR